MSLFGICCLSKESVDWKNMEARLPSRQLLQAQTTASPLLGTVNPLANINGSFLFYANNLTVFANQTSYPYDTDGSNWIVSGCSNATSE